MEFQHIIENNKSFIKEFIPWGQLSGYKDNSYVILLKTKELDIIAYAIIRYDKDGIVLDHEYRFKNIKHAIEWLEVKKEYQKRGYGARLVEYIRDLYYEKKIPICLYAKPVPNDTVNFYYKSGAIILFDDADGIIHNRFLAFMKLDQVEEYFKEGNRSTIDFEEAHSNRKICKVVCEEDEETFVCGWIWKNDDVECEGCKANNYN